MSARKGNYEVVARQDIKVPMRDGVQLACDIYLPARAGKPLADPLPVIMERTPYDKRGISRAERTAARQVAPTRIKVGEYFASHGFAVVMQDCRGRYASEGEFVKYLNEAEDGYDTLAWLVEQPWCNGKVGTMGLSYGAHTQSALASLSPPGLACMFMDSGGFANAYHGGIRRGGAFEMKQATWAYRHALRSPLTAADAARRAALEAVDIEDWFRRQPWSPGNSPLSAAPEFEEYFFTQWRAGTFDAYWQQPGLCAEAHYEQFPDVPVAIVGSWYDPYVHTCLTNFRGLAARNASPVTLLMGPWTHGDRSDSFAGDADFGRQSVLDGTIAKDYWQLRLDWFDRCLRNAAGGGGGETVRYFCMGGGAGGRNSEGRFRRGGDWQSASSWPPPTTVTQILNLHADGSLSGDSAADGECEYRYDPQDPVPTIGGALTSGEPVMRGGAFNQITDARTFRYRTDAPFGPLAARDDVLVFETPPLNEDLVVCGRVTLQLWVSSDCPDTDFTVKLVDVYPDGTAINVTDGILRARYREGWDREVFLQPGEIVPIVIRPFDTASRFCAGHRLRIEVSSSNYPQFDINPNTGVPPGVAGESRVATNRLHFGPQFPSRLELSVMNNKSEK